MDSKDTRRGAATASRPCRNLASLRFVLVSEEGCWDRNVAAGWVITIFDQGGTASEAREVGCAFPKSSGSRSDLSTARQAVQTQR